MSRTAVAKFIRWVAGASFALALVLMQVPPDQVKSNFAEWLKTIGIGPLGDSLTRISDQWITAVHWMGLGLSVWGIVALFKWPKVLWLRARAYVSARFRRLSATSDRLPTSTELQPDWTMHELCGGHLRDGSFAVGLRREIEDQARLGMLAVWG